MSPVHIALAIAIGIAAGVLSGLVGIGGGIILVPALVFGFALTQHKAQGTSLAALLLPVGILAVWRYWKADNVDLRLAALLAAGFALGGYLGGTWAQAIPEASLKRGFALLLILVGIRMLLR